MLAGSMVGTGLSSLANVRVANLPSIHQRQLKQRSSVVVHAEKEGDNTPSADSAQPGSPTPRRRRRRNSAKKEVQPETFNLEDLNPISMGRRSRMIFDDVWTQLQRIGGPSRSISPQDYDIPFELDAPEAFESPRASETTVLVTGATGRVGKVLVRKLLLRGYKVRALVRRRGSDAEVDTDVIPQVVEVVYGDIGDYKSCRAAVEGIDKVICCSAARTTLTADLARVDENGVANLARAFLDSRNALARRAGGVAPSTKIDVADFKQEVYHPLWDIEHVGPPDDQLAKSGYYAETRRRNLNRARDMAEAYIDEDNALIFEGAVYSRDGYAQVGAPVQDLPHGKSLLGTDGLVIRLKGDAHQYTAIVETADGKSYQSKFLTRNGYSVIRLPWNTFLPGKGVDDDVAINPADVAHLSVRFDPKTRVFDHLMMEMSAN